MKEVVKPRRSGENLFERASSLLAGLEVRTPRPGGMIRRDARVWRPLRIFEHIEPSTPKAADDHDGPQIAATNDRVPTCPSLPDGRGGTKRSSSA